jgi:hypothetical protein
VTIDSHAHVSPNYDWLGDWDFDTEQELWAYHQSTNYFHHRPVATSAGGGPAPEAWQLLWDEQNPHSWAGRTDVRFRIEGNQFVWEKDGERYAAPMKPGLRRAEGLLPGALPLHQSRRRRSHSRQEPAADLPCRVRQVKRWTAPCPA